MARRRRSPRRYAAPTRRAGSVLMGSSPARRRHRRSPGRWIGVLILLLVAGAAVGGVVLVQRHRAANDRKRAAARAFAAAWERRDIRAMYDLAERASRPSLGAFKRSYAAADRAAGTRKVVIGRPGALEGGRVQLPVALRTDDFGTLRGTVTLPTVDEDGHGRIAWSPQLRLPGLRKGERPVRAAGHPPRRGEVLAGDGTVLANDGTGAGIAGVPAAGGDPATGLERIYADRLNGHPSETLRFGKRTIRHVKAERGRDVHATIDLALTHTAEAALAGRVGGVAVLKPRSGSVLALAGLAVSAPQPPGSTFKIITLSGALQHHVTSVSESFPIRQYAVLSGVKLHNASDESCGGALPTAFAESCNSVFAPMGAKLGAKRLVATAERFGFNETPNVPAAKPAAIARDLRDDLAVGAAAIGQDRDLATPLAMASVGATIANGGVRARPRVVREEPVRTRRAVRKGVAAQVRDMMIGVVRGGTGTAAALPGVTVAGKTGTAELVPTQGGASDPKNTDAWFVAFAPAEAPQVAVAVMLVGAGAGGAAAAPVAREVLAAAL
ncbi:MAG: penicillin-binding protein [Solirubrobacteraceae bacterium]|nr:penicillin-binding protein [Solirubrobacteraceae bacterium]